MTLPLPYTIEGEQVQGNFDAIAAKFPFGLGDLATAVRTRLIKTSTALQIIAGVIDSTGAGSIVAGTGFTITRNGVGDVTITFTSAFSGTPSVTATVADATNNRIAKLKAATTTTTAQIQCFSLAGTNTDNLFHFHAIGPA